MEKILISACLMGEPVRYDGGAKSSGSLLLQRWQNEGRLLWVCPEVAGGLGVPRPPAEIHGGTGADVLDGRSTVRTKGGEDVTAEFVKGADHALATAQAQGVRIAILKARSPSCGNRQIYDGTHSHTVKDGQGVAAARLTLAGIRVFNEDEVEEAAAYLLALEQDSQPSAPKDDL